MLILVHIEGVRNKVENKIRFEKEKKKMLMLIGIGIVLAILFSIYAFMYVNIGNHLFSLESIFVIAIIILYPMGIVYGLNSIIGLYKKMADNLLVGTTATTAFSILIIEIIGVIIGICFGWIWGLYKAIVTLIQLKRIIQM